MLTRTCFGDKTGLAHFLCKKRLSENVIDLVRACVIEILAFKVYLSSAKLFSELLCVVKTRGSARILIKKLCKLSVEFRVILIVVVSIFKFNNGIHKRFGNILSAVDAKSALFICHDLSILSFIRFSHGCYKLFYLAFILKSIGFDR